MTTKQQANNQANKVLDSIPKKPDDKTDEKIKEDIVRYVKSGKIILFNLEGMDQRDRIHYAAHVALENRKAFLINGKEHHANNVAIPPVASDLDDQTEEEIIKWLKSYADASIIYSPILYLYNLSSSVYDANDNIRVYLKKLGNREGEAHLAYSLGIIIHFSNCKVPKKFRDDFQGEYVEIPPSLSEPKTEVEQQEEKAGESLPKEESKRSCIFQKRDDVYRILYEHESFTLEATDGFKYIRYLLEHPYDAGDRIKAKNKFIPNQLFVATQERLPYDVGIKKYRGHKTEPFSDDEAMMAFEDHMNPKLDKDTGEAARDPGISGFKGGRHGDYTEEVVDRKTKQKIRELENERDIAKTTRNKEKADRVQADIDDIKKGYLHHIMKGGKSRRFVSSFHKKPYDNISQAMNVVYDKIKKHSKAKDYKSMLTWKHLKSSIKFKHSCFFYEPETLPDWIL